MIFCIEPMINAGDWKDTHWADDWTATTVDGKRSVQYEHTILCTDNGYELLSARTEKSKKHWWEMPEYKDELAKYNEFINKK
jgi:methionyl aminopeptidase